MINTISFSDARKLLIDWGFPEADLADRNFVNIPNILSGAKELGIDAKWKLIPEWSSFEMGDSDIEPGQLLSICFDGFNYIDETMIIVTMESYNANKVFVMPYAEYISFAANYSDVIGESMDFVQPMDYIFMLTKQRKIILVHHEGAYTQIDLL